MTTNMDVEENKKRNRSEASISETDGSLLDDSKDTESINHDKQKDNTTTEKASHNDSSTVQHKPAVPVETPKSKPTTRAKRKAKKAKHAEKESEGEWEDLSFKESIHLQLKDISASLSNLVNSTACGQTGRYIMFLESPTEFPTRSDTNRHIQSQKKARRLEFRI